MRVFLVVFSRTLALWFACAQLANAQLSDTSAPTTWEPAYWDKMMLAVKDAKQRGDKIEAETLCSQAIPYVEAQAVKALRQHADLLAACRTYGVDSENRPQRGQFLPDLLAHSPAMGQKDGEKWTAAVDSQPTFHKPDRLLEVQKSASAADARAKAERFVQVKAEQARGNGPSSTYLGFAPWEELYVYVGALQLSQRDSDAQAIRLLAAAYRRSQEVYIRRSILMRERKDPRGEC